MDQAAIQRAITHFGILFERLTSSLTMVPSAFPGKRKTSRRLAESAGIENLSLITRQGAALSLDVTLNDLDWLNNPKLASTWEGLVKG